MSSAVTLAERPHAESESEDASDIALTPQAWLDTRWVGERSDYATTRDLFAGAWVPDPERRAVCRLYAAACADLAQATLGGVPPHSADWDRWFGALRTAARELSPANAGAHVVRRALYHGARLEGATASWAHRLRRGFAAMLAASLSEPVPALIGEDLAVFRAHDAAWLAQDTAQDGAPQVPGNPRAPAVTLAPPNPECSRPIEAVRWPTASLRPNPLNPRSRLDPADIDELAASIVAHAAHGGILQPLLVTPDGTVVAGHRRLAAARRVGLADVPVIVHSLTTIEVLEIQLTENLQR